MRKIFKENGLMKERVQQVAQGMLGTNTYEGTRIVFNPEARLNVITEPSKIDMDYAVSLLEHFNIPYTADAKSIKYDGYAFFRSGVGNWLGLY